MQRSHRPFASRRPAAGATAAASRAPRSWLQRRRLRSIQCRCELQNGNRVASLPTDRPCARCRRESQPSPVARVRMGGSSSCWFARLSGQRGDDLVGVAPRRCC
eukprot:1476779-Pleurochrysis_carterae.AAC.1